MLHPSDLHDYQVRAVNHQVANPASFLFLDPGLGKTVVTLTSFAHLKQHGCARALLVVGPLRVVQSVWAQEARKWSHLAGLRFSLIHGNPDQRMRALARPADVYLVNYENLVWMAAQLQHYYIRRGTELPFDMLALDESTKLKSVNTKRMAAFLPLVPYFRYRTGLTGTPASNGLEDLFGQFLVVDQGQRLGTSYSHYLATYFTPEDHNGYKYRATADGERFIHQRVSDIVLEMNASDYLTMPDLIVNDIYVDLQSKHRAQYEELERNLLTELDNGVPLEVLFESAKMTKLLQYSNGATIVNSETGEWHPTHDAKLEALDSIIEEASGQPVLVAYNYRADAQRILQRYKFAVNLTGVSGSEFNATLDRWRAGDIRLLLAHPASAGHGVDGLQDAGHIMVWFGLNWSLELYLQFNARLHRQGQAHPVICHRVLARDTWDDVVSLSLETKDGVQRSLRRAVDLYRKRKEGRLAA